MDFFTAMDVSSAAMSAERTRMNLISGNLANAKSTRTAEGGPYRRKDAVFTATPLAGTFAGALARVRSGVDSVAVTAIVEDSSPPRMEYDPTHPDADQNGNVFYPNVDINNEMVDLMLARRIHEANVTAFQAAKQMLRRAIDI